MNRTIVVTRNVLSRAAAPALLMLAALALAGCETTGTGPGPAAQAAPAEPMTHTKAAEECWMSTERTDASMNLDKRADIVTNCIRQKMGDTAPKAKS